MASISGAIFERTFIRDSISVFLMSDPTGMLHGKHTECPKCHSKFLETYMSNGGNEQQCPDCGWNSEEHYDFEMNIG
jgi:DNA-directed RNA polymerase subunit RPC12/RpoP